MGTERQNIGGGKGILLTAAVIAGGYWLTRPAVDPVEAAAAELARICGEPYEALAMSKDFVRDNLKAPSTASFPSIADPDVSVQVLGDCRFSVKAWVDAQNSFGAMLRSTYTMSLRYDAKTQTWHASDIAIR